MKKRSKKKEWLSEKEALWRPENVGQGFQRDTEGISEASFDEWKLEMHTHLLHSRHGYDIW